MRAEKPFIHTRFYRHVDFTFPPSHKEFWTDLLNLSLRSFDHLVQFGRLERDELYEEIFNNPDVDKSLELLIESRKEILSRKIPTK